jgi:hypothetical protein
MIKKVHLLYGFIIISVVFQCRTKQKQFAPKKLYQVILFPKLFSKFQVNQYRKPKKLFKNSPKNFFVCEPIKEIQFKITKLED